MKHEQIQLSRRSFLLTGAAVTGGLLVGTGFVASTGPSMAAPPAGGVALNAWVKVQEDGRVALSIPRAEMGQGVYTSLTQLIAEELEIGLDKIIVSHPDVDGAYTNFVIALGDPPEGDKGPFRWVAEKAVALVPYIGTGGSTSIRDGWESMRIVGASAREMLVAAAAKKLNVPAAELSVKEGVISHGASGKSLPFGEVAADAAKEKPPAKPKLKPASEFKLVGKPVPRVDIPEKVDGRAIFSLDVREEGMLFAAITQCPVYGGKLKSFDANAIKDRRGVVKALAVGDNAVAVVADSYWRASEALKLLPVTWSEGAAATLDQAEIDQRMMAALDAKSTHTFREEGKALEAIKAAAKTVEATYQVPYLAHATMEPMNCTVKLTGDSAQIWVGSQSPTVAKWACAEGTGVARDKVTTHITYLGGGFGRRAEKDFMVQAAKIAKEMPGKMVQLIWSREEDMAHDMYRPQAASRFKAGLDAKNMPVAWINRIASQSVGESFGDRNMPWGGMGGHRDKMNAEGAYNLPYGLGTQLVDHTLLSLPVPVGNWRSVGHSQNAFFTESFLDELAHSAGEDPVAFRRKLLDKAPRFRAVLDLAAEKAGWGTALPAGRGRGVALHESFGAICAQVAEVEISPKGELKVLRVTAAIDCGSVVNPDTVKAQVESGIIYGLTAALYGKITIKGGRAEQMNFPDYEMVRLANSPAMDVHIVPSTARPGGVGEPGTPPIAPAVINAIFAATGKRVRRLPIMDADLGQA